IKALGDTWQDSFVKELETPLPSEAVNSMFDKARLKIQAARSELARPGIDVTKLTPASAAPLHKLGEAKFASAQAKGSAEAVNMQLRSQYGSAVAKNNAAD